MIQIWHRWLVNDCHCQEPANDCCYQKPIGPWKKSVFVSIWLLIPQRWWGVAVLWHNWCITYCHKAHARGSKAFSPLLKSTTGTLQSRRQRGFTPSSAAHLPWALSHFHLSQHPATSMGRDTYFSCLSFLPGWFRLRASGQQLPLTSPSHWCWANHLWSLLESLCTTAGTLHARAQSSIKGEL